MTRKLMWVMGVILLTSMAGTVYWSTKKATVAVYASQPISARPYVMERVQYRVDNGQATTVAHELLAQRRDGTTVKLMPEAGVRRVDHPDGYVAMIVDRLKLKSTAQKPKDMVATQKNQMQSAPQNCIFGLNEFVDGEDVILGQKALRIMTLPPNGLEREIDWRLPDFGCITIQTLLQTRPELGAGWTTTHGIRPEAFAEKEPDPRLFSNDANFSEVKPSEITHRMLAEAGVTEKDCQKCLGTQDAGDKNYEKWGRPSYVP